MGLTALRDLQTLSLSSGVVQSTIWYITYCGGCVHANHGTIRVNCLAQGHKKRHTNFWHQWDSNPRRGVIHVF